MFNFLKTGLIGAMLISGSVTMAQAEDRIIASVPNTLLKFFTDQGVAAKLETDNVGDPLINVRYYGTTFSVFFFGCDDNVECQSVQYFSGYRDGDDVSLTELNEWNTENRYLRAYKSDSGAVRIEYDIFLGDTGLTTDDFDSAFTGWTRGLTEFEEFIDY